MKTDIIINARNDISPGVYWNGNSNGDIGWARILLHELSHVANLLLGGGGSRFRDDDRPPAANWRNNQVFNQGLEKKCFP